MFARLNQQLHTRARSLHYTHLIGLFLIIQGFVSIDMPSGGALDFMANTMRISPRLYAYVCLLCGVWCWSRPKTRAVLVYLSPFAWYVFVGALTFLFGQSIPAQIFGVLGYAFAFVALVALGVKTSREGP